MRRNFSLILGAVLATAGVGVLGYPLLSQAFAPSATAPAHAIEQQLRAAAPADATTGDENTAEGITFTDIGSYGTDYGVLYIPSLGEEYVRAIQVGATQEVVDRNVLGVYDGSERAGEVGNLVLAGHREGVLNDLRLLEEGDHILIRTADGFYRYTMTREEIIKPTEMEVLNDVPLSKEAAMTAMLTLITCYPEWGNTERRIIIAELTEWLPASEAGTNGLPL
ncbi:class E sortase [Agrococcus sediminis]|uniref:Class E sortase n=1 Tax=Agrococcus sediminis TaxID=2599924 RepID=A0A5M8QNZ2_9MICO|nr:sortase [Agrococcus sediminis]KAA6436446.1 class E sortase [Agrococcus sediminis]